MLGELPVPTRVIVYFPGATAASTLIVATDFVTSGLGRKVKDTPVGWPEYVKVALLEPSRLVKSTSAEPLEPGDTTTTEGTVWSKKLT
jgi:hypothetical protein